MVASGLRKVFPGMGATSQCEHVTLSKVDTGGKTAVNGRLALILGVQRGVEGERARSQNGQKTVREFGARSLRRLLADERFVVSDRVKKLVVLSCSRMVCRMLQDVWRDEGSEGCA